MTQQQTPSSRWAAEGNEDPHGQRYNCERHELTKGDLTDDELANEVFLKPYDIGHLQAAKDRIRWLSRKADRLEKELASIKK